MHYRSTFDLLVLMVLAKLYGSCGIHLLEM